MLGASTTQLFRNLSYALNFTDGNIIISQIDHEANIASWVDFAQRHGLAIKWWKASEGTNPKLLASDLKELLTQDTRLVTCCHASNILGTINDVRAIADEVHKQPGALFCVDGVAYAPHRPIDVQAFGVDFYAFSWYKVYGPHQSILYGSLQAQKSLRSLGHSFNPSKTLEDKLGLAGSSYELTQSLTAVLDYLGPKGSPTWDGVIQHEQLLQTTLLKYLNGREDVTIYGETSDDGSIRVPTISFVARGWKPQHLVEAVEKVSNIGFRWGAFYSNRLVESLGLAVSEGVTRVSMVHYNTGMILFRPLLSAARLT